MKQSSTRAPLRAKPSASTRWRRRRVPKPRSQSQTRHALLHLLAQLAEQRQRYVNGQLSEEDWLRLLAWRMAQFQLQEAELSAYQRMRVGPCL